MPRLSTLFALLFAAPLSAQMMQMPNFEHIPADKALDKSLKNNVLTSNGVPFHAVLDITPEKPEDAVYQGRVEIFWESEHRYRTVVESKGFGQTLIVDGDRVMETDRGDFYPNWLHGFVTALLDPMPRLKDLRGRNDMIDVGEKTYSCVRRDDKPGGITDQLTWAQVCFSGYEPALEFVIDFTYSMEFHDYSKFGKKRIAHTYVTSEGDHSRLRGTLRTLEEWRPQADLLTVTQPTASADRILTTFVSTLKEESMVESAPKDVEWPSTREGKTEGYMIVHALTDRTGQVRETSKHNSDNPGMESFGRLVALKYKFKPLIVDGIPQQMEMPLVLHFSTHIADPIPELEDATARKLITGCDLPHEIKDPASAGQEIFIQFQVQTDGKLMTLGASDRKIPVMMLYQQFRGCHFGVYSRNGVPTAYHANVKMTAR